MSTGYEVMLASLAYANGATQWTQTAGTADGDESAIAFAPHSYYGDAIAGLSSDRVSRGPSGYVATWDPLDVFAWQGVYPPPPTADQGRLLRRRPRGQRRAVLRRRRSDTVVPATSPS